jgi:hypothetical protein
VARLYPQALGSLFVTSYDSQGYGGCIRGGALSLSLILWTKAPVWGLRPDFYYCQTVAGLLMCGALYDERTGLSFITAPGPRQHSPLRVRVPWDS